MQAKLTDSLLEHFLRTFRRYESLEEIVHPVAPAGTYQARVADRLSCVTTPSLTAYSTLQHALQVRNDGIEHDMMAPMVEDARIEDVYKQWNENVDTLVVFVRDHQVDLSSSKRV